MIAWLYSDLASKVKTDLDLLDETFITTSELIGYYNEGLREAAAEICKINEDYFLSSHTLSWTSGTSLYSVPTDIYISKIRSLIYVNGTETYPIQRIRRMKEFQTIAELTNFEPNADYRYILTNGSVATGPQFHFYPAPRASGTFVTVWYLRDPAEVLIETDPVDLPEFVNFIMQFMRVRCYEKEGNPNLQMALAALESERKLMVDTLTEMVPDDQNEIQRDLSHYWDHT